MPSESKNTCLKISLGIFVTATVCLTGVLVWKEKFQPVKFFGDQILDTVDLVTAVIERFPDFFIKTDDLPNFEQKYYRLLGNYTEVPLQPGPANQSCFFDCSGDYIPQRRKRRGLPSNVDSGLHHRQKRAVTFYHGCCESNIKFAPRETIRTIWDDSERTVVQFEKRKQYFPVHECQRTAGCGGCRCVQTKATYTAVVLKPGVDDVDQLNDVEVVVVKLDEGCCICINT